MKEWKVAWVNLNADGDAIGFGNLTVEINGDLAQQDAREAVEKKILAGYERNPSVHQVKIVNYRPA